MRSEYLLSTALLMLYGCSAQVEGVNARATHQSMLESTVTVPQATQVEATRISNIVTQQADLVEQSKLKDQAYPLNNSAVTIFYNGYCSGVLISKEPAYDRFGNLIGEFGYIDTSSHCLSDTPVNITNPKPGSIVSIAKLENKSGIMEETTFINQITYGQGVDDERYLHNLVVVIGNIGAFEGINPTGLDAFDAYNGDSNHDCIAMGVPWNGTANLPTYGKIQVDNGPLTDGLYAAEIEVGNGGLSGGPLVCKDTAGDNKIVGEIQWKASGLPSLSGVSIFTKRDIDVLKFSMQQIRETAVKWVYDQQ